MSVQWCLCGHTVNAHDGAFGACGPLYCECRGFEVGPSAPDVQWLK